MKMIKFYCATIFLIAVVGLFQSCYYDNELYVYGRECDNSILTYSARIKSIADNNCAISGCHIGPSPSDNISFEGFDNCKASTENTATLCAINRESGCNPMPKNLAQLSQCDIDAWQAWVAAGYPN